MKAESFGYKNAWVAVKGANPAAVGLFVSRGLWRQGQGCLLAILEIYYLCALAFLAVSNDVMFTPGFC